MSCSGNIRKVFNSYIKRRVPDSGTDLFAQSMELSVFVGLQSGNQPKGRGTVTMRDRNARIVGSCDGCGTPERPRKVHGFRGAPVPLSLRRA